jgi:molybdate transport system substrate-binding protein
MKRYAARNPLSSNRRAALLGLLALFVQPCNAVARPAAAVTVFAAASLTDSLKAVADAYKARTGVTVTLSFGASSILARQIDQGAQADIFMSADTDWMDFLQKGGHIAKGSRKDLLNNQLVLIAASDSKAAPRIAPHFDLAGVLGDRRLALADPASVPAGKYAKAALTNLGVWDSVASRLAPAENVRVALEYVARGEAPFGMVYATDAKIAPSVRVVGVFPASSHPPITYPVALMKGASAPARDFLTFLSGSDARAIFEKAGFTLR